MNKPFFTLEEKGSLILERLYQRVNHSTEIAISVFELAGDEFTKDETLTIRLYLFEEGWAGPGLISSGRPDIRITIQGVKKVESIISSASKQQEFDWESSESQAEGLKNQIINHQRRLQVLEEQAALKGHNSEPELLIEIEDIKARVDNLKRELKERGA